MIHRGIWSRNPLSSRYHISCIIIELFYGFYILNTNTFGMYFQIKLFPFVIFKFHILSLKYFFQCFGHRQWLWKRWCSVVLSRHLVHPFTRLYTHTTKINIYTHDIISLISIMRLIMQIFFLIIFLGRFHQLDYLWE